MGIGGIWQWVVVLIVILLLFGTKRLRNLGSDLGHAVRGFRKGIKSDGDPDKIGDSNAANDEKASVASETKKEAEVSPSKEDSAPAAEK